MRWGRPRGWALALFGGVGLTELAGQPVGETVFASRRAAMVRVIAAQGVRDPAVLTAMGTVPRHEFVRPDDRDLAYEDHPLRIDRGQTISQPYIVGYMTEALRPRPGMRVLEVGTGSGYQAAVLGQIGCEVYSVEIVPELARTARERLERLGYRSVRVRHGDGYAGWAEAAPFDAIIVTAAPGFVPPALVRQLAANGRMIVPVEEAAGRQRLTLIEKDSTGRVRTRKLLPVRFVPMVRGKARPGAATQ
jgi:protein-L-isoaspartate(D-aspartate) O-methyltransferase